MLIARARTVTVAVTNAVLPAVTVRTLAHPWMRSEENGKGRKCGDVTALPGGI